MGHGCADGMDVCRMKRERHRSTDDNNNNVAPEGRNTMKVGKWDMIPLSERRQRSRKNDIKVRSMVAIQDNRRVLLHRVEKRKEDGTTEVFIIKASPDGLETDH